MVDIHSHVLPGLDDGARTFDDSVTMLKMAADTGTTAIVATPHANTEFAFDPELVRTRLAELQAAVGNRIRLYSGCDFHLMFENMQDALANPNKYTINQKQWLLVEFSDFIIFPNSADLLARLREGGMIPVITHPERNQILQSRFDQLQQWVREGAYLQVTAQSLLGVFGSEARRFSERLIEAGLVHFIASDAHDTSYRTTRLDQAYQWLAEHYGEDFARLVTRTNPAATIEGLPEIEDSGPVKRRRKFLGLFG
jgi:protein-tyrosine phosphatase